MKIEEILIKKLLVPRTPLPPNYAWKATATIDDEKVYIANPIGLLDTEEDSKKALVGLLSALMPALERYELKGKHEKQNHIN